MSMLFDHWHEDEYAGITKGDLNRLEYENEKLREKAEKYDKLKEAVMTIKATLEHDYIGECLYDGGIEHAIDVIDKNTEGLI